MSKETRVISLLKKLYVWVWHPSVWLVRWSPAWAWGTPIPLCVTDMQGVLSTGPRFPRTCNAAQIPSTCESPQYLSPRNSTHLQTGAHASSHSLWGREATSMLTSVKHVGDRHRSGEKLSQVNTADTGLLKRTRRSGPPPHTGSLSCLCPELKTLRKYTDYYEDCCIIIMNVW